MSSSSHCLASSVALLMAAGVLPAAAQQRTEVVIRRAPRAEIPDSVERQLRPMQRQLDSLTRLYIEGDGLTATERRRLVDELNRAVERMTVASERLGAAQVRVQGVQIRDRASMPMSRSMFDVQAVQMQMMPKGWIGFVAVGAGIPTRFEQGELIVRYRTYPKIVSVDPSSPAQRAGIIPGDTLISYSGLDVRDNDISLTRLLQPNSRVTVRVRRDGRFRDIPVVIAEAPQRIAQRRDDEMRDPHDSWVIAGVPNAPSFARPPLPPVPAGGAVSVGIRASTALTAPAMPAAPAPGGVINFRPTLVMGMASGVAGAQMAAITEGLARITGVASGVLVTVVPVGSPANESGLQEGDVITRVSGRAVRSVTEVRELVGAAAQNGERDVELDILRDKRAQKLILRW